MSTKTRSAAAKPADKGDKTQQPVTEEQLRKGQKPDSYKDDASMAGPDDIIPKKRRGIAESEDDSGTESEPSDPDSSDESGSDSDKNKKQTPTGETTTMCFVDKLILLSRLVVKMRGLGLLLILGSVGFDKLYVETCTCTGACMRAMFPGMVSDCAQR